MNYLGAISATTVFVLGLAWPGALPMVCGLIGILYVFLHLWSPVREQVLAGVPDPVPKKAEPRVVLGPAGAEVARRVLADPAFALALGQKDVRTVRVSTEVDGETYHVEVQLDPLPIHVCDQADPVAYGIRIHDRKEWK